MLHRTGFIVCPDAGMAFPQTIQLPPTILLTISNLCVIIFRDSRRTPRPAASPSHLIPISLLRTAGSNRALCALPKTGARRNSPAINKLQTLYALPKTGARRNYFGIKGMRTLYKNTGGVGRESIRNPKVLLEVCPCSDEKKRRIPGKVGIYSVRPL